MPLQWGRWREPELVFIDQLSVSRPDTSDMRDVYLFGMRHELRDADLGGTPIGEGCFIEFLALEMISDREADAHRLHQHSSVTFSEFAEPKDYVPASTMKNAAEFSLREKPRWKASGIGVAMPAGA